VHPATKQQYYEIHPSFLGMTTLDAPQLEKSATHTTSSEARNGAHLDPDMSCVTDADGVASVDHSEKFTHRLSARVVVEEREILSDERYEGVVAHVTRSFAWIRPLSSMDLPTAAKAKLTAMNIGVRRKALRKSRKPFCGGTTEHVVYVGFLDLVGRDCLPRVGAKVSFKVYMDLNGIGGCEVIITKEPEDVGMAPNGPPSAPSNPYLTGGPHIPPPPPPIKGSIANNESASPDGASDGAPMAFMQNFPTDHSAERKPRYLERFAVKVSCEERVVLEGWYEGEVVKCSRLFAWVKPMNPASIPADVQPKLQEMNDQFRQKAAEKEGRIFCDGIEQNVIYVANADLASQHSVLLVGMKVQFKLYTDNKGVGGYEVIACEDHVKRVVKAIQRNLSMEEGKQMTLHVSSVFGSPDGAVKEIAFCKTGT